VIRTLIAVTLCEVSVVGTPAHPATSVDLRSCPVTLRSKLTCSEDDSDDDCDPEVDDDCEDDDEDRSQGRLSCS
jgi:hypothetical protein